MPATALFDQLAEVRARLNAAEHLLLGLDYDGTLTPLVNDRWRGEFQVTSLGYYEYTVIAWVDHFLSWRHDLT
ncbi:MAG TPA: DUF3416 domain-containing protein, partial [Gemmatales bacterium]|nr:DUF3416 domain-containing protein [Gemmatales bacterium]